MGASRISKLRLWVDQQGAINILFAILLLPLLGLVGMAVDSSRAYAVKLRLQESIDSAALVAAKNFSDSNRDQMIQDYFDENWKDGFMDTAAPTLTFTDNATTRSVTINAQVTMPTIFMRLWGDPSVTVGTLTSSVSALTYLEVALALDNTTSMRAEVSTGVRRVDAMKTAAKGFIDTLFTEGGTLKNTIANMWVSVIPFTSMVNVGPQHADTFLVPNSTDNILWDYPRNTTAQNSWRGCVFERSFYSSGGTYPGNDVTDENPDAEKFYPYHVAPGAFEAMALCAGPPPCATGQDYCWDGVCRASGTCPPHPGYGPPPPAPPPAPCIVDGFPCKAGINLPNKALGAKANSNIINVATCRNGVPAPGVPNYWTGYNISPLSLVYQTAQGIKIYYPSPDGYTPMAYNGAIAVPPYNDVAVNASRNTSGVSVCCHGSSGAGGDSFSNISNWTSTGRWIAPWPNATTPKLGGWGNSGCGIPLLPLEDTHAAITAKIDEMDVPPLRNPSASASDASNKPDLGYSGTLINQGLVWGWRTVSEKWRGWWKDSGGTPDTALPLDYATVGSSKAVVVMTDGLNFMPDPIATTAYGGGSPLYFGQASLVLNWSDPNVIKDYTCAAPGMCSGTIDWGGYTDGYGMNDDAVDNSAYGLLGKGIGTEVSRAQQHCEVRRTLAMEPHLNIWGCKEYEPMLRNAAGNPVRSGAGGWGPYDLQSALTGPYYDELTRRLLLTCTAMKARNIRIFFILFAINDNPQKAAALSAFNSCVGGNGGVYDAGNATELNNAFQAIAIRLRALRLQQ